MARKKLGHVELQWTCPNCSGINPGPEKTCQACGAPQPEDVQFEQAERQELITEGEKITQAEAGADIHCPFCGTRNTADAETCTQCGGDLVEGTRREAGRVVGAYKTGPVQQVACPNCGAENPDTAKSCIQCGAPMTPEEPIEAPVPVPEPGRKTPKWLPIVIIGVVIIACGFIAWMLFKTDQETGTVQSVNWERSIDIQALVPVEYSDWEDQIPDGASILACEMDERSVADQPQLYATEVCGTPYNVDSGGGFAEVVQDCEYHVYDNRCDFTVMEWGIVNTAVLTGSDFNPVWPEPLLEEGQRLGSEQVENYVILFDTGDRIYTYTTSDVTLFQQAQIGSTWTLEINQLGGIVRIER